MLIHTTRANDPTTAINPAGRTVSAFLLTLVAGELEEEWSEDWSATDVGSTEECVQVGQQSIPAGGQNRRSTESEGRSATKTESETPCS